MITNYYEIQILFNRENYEELYNKLYLHGVENILEEQGVLKIYFTEEDINKIDSLKKYMLSSGIISEMQIEVLKLENKNWDSEWKSSIEPVYIKDKIIIYPSWKKEQLTCFEDKILIEIDPKMSFGTGHNETTQLVLELMCENIKGDEKKLLDFGCGTGVLSIAGIKLGVQRATAIDIDEDSIINASECFQKNHVSDKIKLLQVNLPGLNESNFDIICANIIRSVIVDNFEKIYEKLKTNGKLFLSGILDSEDRIILELLFQNDIEVIDILKRGEWIGIYAVKR